MSIYFSLGSKKGLVNHENCFKSITMVVVLTFTPATWDLQHAVNGGIQQLFSSLDA